MENCYSNHDIGIRTFRDSLSKLNLYPLHTLNHMVGQEVGEELQDSGEGQSHEGPSEEEEEEDMRMQVVQERLAVNN